MSSMQLGRTVEGYKLLKKLGVGSFGETYYAQSLKTNATYAMKIEILDPHKTRILLDTEREILEDLKEKGCRYTPEFFEAQATAKYAYLTMDCLGPSLSKVQGVFGDLTLKTAVRVGIHMLLALREIHMNGYLHRDVKPSNFLVVPNRRTVVKLIDFGLSRRFLDKESGDIIRCNTGFVGSLKYASVNAHNRSEITQRDDLMSWFYCLIDMVKGKLPWHRISNEKHIVRVKENITARKLCEKCPKQFISTYAYVKGLEEYETPDYFLLVSFLLEAMRDNSIKWEEPYDWDYLTKKELQNISAISLKAEKSDVPDIPDLPKILPPAELPEKYISFLNENSRSEASEASSVSCKCSIC